MSRTHKVVYTSIRKNGRGNPYGLCQCKQCRWGRRGGSAFVTRVKHKFRTAWKTGKEFVKGAYTD